RLRPVRQRQDRAQGDAQPVRADVDGGLRSALESDQHVGEFRDAVVAGQRRRHSASVQLGPLSNTAFGQVSVATRYDPETINGFDKRRNNWEVSTTISHELMPRVSTEVSYFRRAQGHFTTTDNLDVAPSDFQTYCVTAPTDSRLPNGGGFQVCGL